MSKGSKQRPVDKKRFDAGFERIFGKKPTSHKKLKKKDTKIFGNSYGTNWSFKVTGSIWLDFFAPLLNAIIWIFIFSAKNGSNLES